jgi:hypothetical protein
MYKLRWDVSASVTGARISYAWTVGDVALAFHNNPHAMVDLFIYLFIYLFLQAMAEEIYLFIYL